MVGLLSPLTRILPSDNPASIRLRKYLTGTHLVLDDVDVPVGCTPARTVWRRGKARLYRYGGRPRFPVPLVLVYALINRPYILDLVPGRSLVEFLVAEGFDVYLLDWGVPDAADSTLGLDDYVLDYLPAALAAARETSAAAAVSLLGHCQGGTIGAVYAALFPDALRNLVLLAAPIDFAPHRPGARGAWTLWSRHAGRLAALPVDASGNVPADVPAGLAGAAARMTRQLPGVAGAAAAAAAAVTRRAADDETLRAWLGASRWVDDAVPLPGRLFQQWARDCYGRNLLVRGGLRLRGQPVRLSAVTASVLNVAGTRDRITPLSQAIATPRRVGSADARSLVVQAGHVGLVAGPTARSEFWRPLRDWLAPRSGAGGGP